MNYPLIAVVGPSGTGKTASLRNLDPKTTRIVNAERKFLSFENAVAFNDSMSADSVVQLPQGIEMEIDKAIKDPQVKVIVLDSLTSYFERVLALSRNINKGYDIYSHYNKSIGALLNKLKGCGPKWVICTAIDEILSVMGSDGSNSTVKRIAVSGKEWEGKIEKEFTIVLATDVIKKPGGQMEYKFITNTNGVVTAKTPQGMFKEQLIDNDIQAVINRAEAYWKIERNVLVD